VRKKKAEQKDGLKLRQTYDSAKNDFYGKISFKIIQKKGF
jgi:hypothetical protein